MKIKQSTKMIILVVALVSVIGVGAVSFAAWDGGAPSITASASVGQVDLIGFSATSLDLGTDKLIPYNQGIELPAGTTYMIRAALPSYVVSGENYTITLSANADSELPVNLASKCYYKIVDSTEEVTAPTTTLDGWTKVGTATDLTDVAYGDAPVTNKVIYIVLDSIDIADMNGSAEFTITLAA